MKPTMDLKKTVARLKKAQGDFENLPEGLELAYNTIFDMVEKTIMDNDNLKLKFSQNLAAAVNTQQGGTDLRDHADEIEKEFENALHDGIVEITQALVRHLDFAMGQSYMQNLDQRGLGDADEDSPYHFTD